MKKKRVVKILAGAAVAALCVTGAASYWAFHAAGVIGTAEIGTYTAGTNKKEWEAAHDSLTAAGEAVKQAAKVSVAEKAAAAESVEDAETAQKPNQTTQKNQQTTQATQNTQQAAQTTQNTQSAQPAQSEQSTQQSTQSTESAQTNQSAQTTQSAETVQPTPAPTYPTTYTCSVCGVQYYDQNEAVAHAKTHAVPEPAPAPQPATKRVEVCMCECGAWFYTVGELTDHQFNYEMGQGHDHSKTSWVEVPA